MCMHLILQPLFFFGDAVVDELFSYGSVIEFIAEAGENFRGANVDSAIVDRGGDSDGGMEIGGYEGAREGYGGLVGCVVEQDYLGCGGVVPHH
mmetsp:Transcript_17204/g.21136  ORF Transcript_17204/g.21136 Transcript_17204/m.21136 type:complete len:93 (+) Transcript_17204:528-806(+)